MQLSNEALSELIGAIYDCALDARQWQPTLARLAAVLGGCNGTIMRHGHEVAGFAYSWGVPVEAQRAYQAEYAGVNPLLTLPWHCEVGEPVSLARFMTPAELRATRFYREFLAPLGWFDFMVVPLEKSAGVSTTISVTRAEAAGPPGETEMAAMRLLAPHFRRAAMFHGLVEGEARRAADLAATLDAMPVPVLLFDQSGACIEANAAATRLLGDGGRLRLTEDGVVAELATAPNRLYAKLPQATRRDRSALVQSSKAGMGEAMSFTLTGPDGGRHVAQVMRIRAAASDRLGIDARAAAVMFVQPVGALQPLPGEVLVKLYGLTPAETRLAALLARGRVLEEAAAVLGISIATARSHLQRLFEKTGTRRQAQLVRLVLSALPQGPG